MEEIAVAEGKDVRESGCIEGVKVVFFNVKKIIGSTMGPKAGGLVVGCTI